VVRFSYEAAIRLVHLGERFWREIDGTCARSGVDPLALDFTRFLNLVYSFITEHMDEETRTRFEEDLYAPVEGRDPDEVPSRVVEDEMAAFMAFTRQNEALGGA